MEGLWRGLATAANENPASVWHLEGGALGRVSGTLTRGTGRTPSAKIHQRGGCSSGNVGDDKPVRHARLEMLEYAGLSSRRADRQRLAVCHAKLDDISAVALRTVDHDAVLAARRGHAHLRRSFDQSSNASRPVHPMT